MTTVTMVICEPDKSLCQCPWYSRARQESAFPMTTVTIVIMSQTESGYPMTTVAMNIMIHTRVHGFYVLI